MKKKLFDYVIGNPPYQEEVENNGKQAWPREEKLIDINNLLVANRVRPVV